MPGKTVNVVSDAGYDNNAFGECIEYDAQGRRTGRHFICPPNLRNQHGDTPQVVTGCVQRHRQRRIRFYQSRGGQRLYARRSQTVKPFNERFKALFELSKQVWHYGLPNNRTQVMLAIFCYQLLIRYNYRLGRKNGQIHWVLDTL